MKRMTRRAITLIALVGAMFTAAATAAEPAKKAAGDVARGRYLAIVGGCNDCHTAGFAPSEGKVPESQWLLGDSVLGFAGPWGTTYAPNLRNVAASMSEAEWVKFTRTLRVRPPMPWFTLNQWTESDLRALYRYIRQLGPPGEAVTVYLPPGQAAKGPVLQWPAPPPK